MRWGCGSTSDELGEAFAAAVEVGADCVDGKAEGDGDAFVAALFLVVEDEDGALDFGEVKESGVDGVDELGVGEELLGVAGVVGQVVAREVFEPGGFGIVVEGGLGGDVFALFAAALPLVLGDVDDDAVEVGGDGGVAAEVRKGAVEAEEDFLGEVFDLRAGAGHACERAENHALVLAHEGFEVFRRCEVELHSLGALISDLLRLQDEPKVSCAPLKLSGCGAV